MKLSNDDPRRTASATLLIASSLHPRTGSSLDPRRGSRNVATGEAQSAERRTKRNPSWSMREPELPQRAHARCQPVPRLSVQISNLKSPRPNAPRRPSRENSTSPPCRPFVPNGDTPSSPGLRRSRYPGFADNKPQQPKRGCGLSLCPLFPRCPLMPTPPPRPEGACSLPGTSSPWSTSPQQHPRPEGARHPFLELDPPVTMNPATGSPPPTDTQ